MPKPVIFIIDDQESVRHALAEMLDVFGYAVETFETADAFLGACDPGRAGCIVADVRMPGMSGIELVEELSRRRSALPVVLISGHADVPMAVAAIKAGAEDFIEKPVDDVQLVAAINRGLARAFERQSQQQSLQELGAQFERPLKVWAHERVVHGHPHLSVVGQCGQAGNVHQLEKRVRRRFQPD